MKYTNGWTPKDGTPITIDEYRAVQDRRLDSRRQHILEHLTQAKELKDENQSLDIKIEKLAEENERLRAQVEADDDLQALRRKLTGGVDSESEIERLKKQNQELVTSLKNTVNAYEQQLHKLVSDDSGIKLRLEFQEGSIRVLGEENARLKKRNKRLEKRNKRLEKTVDGLREILEEVLEVTGFVMDDIPGWVRDVVFGKN